MALVFDALRFALLLFLILLVGRIVISLVMSFAREWRPKGFGLVMTELCFSVTDPPLKALRRVIPSFDIGGLRIDLAMLALFAIVYLLMFLLGAIQAAL